MLIRLVNKFKGYALLLPFVPLMLLGVLCAGCHSRVEYERHYEEPNCTCPSTPTITATLDWVHETSTEDMHFSADVNWNKTFDEFRPLESYVYEIKCMTPDGKVEYYYSYEEPDKEDGLLKFLDHTGQLWALDYTSMSIRQIIGKVPESQEAILQTLKDTEAEYRRRAAGCDRHGEVLYHNPPRI